MNHFLVLLKARNLELLRDKATWIWNFIFPLVLIIGIAVIFGGKESALYKVGVVGADNPSIAAFKTTRYLQFIDYAARDVALKKLQHQQLDLVLEGGSETNYWVNDTSPQGYLLEKILLASSNNSPLQKQVVNGRQVRYLDWVLPGILGINMMSCSFFGVGFVIVRYRKNGVLKRLKATPVNAFEFLSAQVVSRLLMLLVVIVFQFVSMNFLFDFFVQGSYSLLLLIAMLGTTSLISLGLLMASRTSSEELAAGLINLLTWPMMLLSGVWFSLEGTPELVQKAALLFPLTHILKAARAVMLDNAGLVDVTPEILTLLAMTLLFLITAALRFKWVAD
ncbi:MAG: ABC transporter permease [Methylococcaceae bacterium]|nr:ABC transporter permease [Methylococcaceae bacterium]